MFGPVLAFIVGWGRFREERDHSRTDALLPVNFLGSSITFFGILPEGQTEFESRKKLYYYDSLFIHVLLVARDDIYILIFGCYIWITLFILYIMNSSLGSAWLSLSAEMGLRARAVHFR